MDPISREMLRQAVAAAKDGDRETALQLVRDVIEDNASNAQAWFLLARLTSDKEEKIDALYNVTALDPTNDKARAMLQSLEGVVEIPKDEIIPGISRRMLQMVGAGLVVVVLFIFAILMIANNSRNQRNAARQTEAYLPTLMVLERTETSVAIAQLEADATATFFAENTPTPTITTVSGLPTLPPTHTPTPTVTPTPTEPPPAPIEGLLIGVRGRQDATQDLELVRFPSGTYSSTGLFSNTRQGRYPNLFPGNTTYLYIEYDRNSFSDRLYRHNSLTGETTLITPNSDEYPFDSIDMISLSPDGSLMTFIATPFGENYPAVYLYTFFNDSTQRMTMDEASYSYPSIAPHNSEIVAVRQTTTGQNPGTDLVTIDIAFPFPESLTTDRDQIVESHPRWSVEGDFVFYAGKEQGSNDHNIYVISPTNPGTGLRRIATEGDDIMPVPDPSGRYVAFASNKDGQRYYDVYVFDLTTTEITRQTNSDSDHEYPSDWK
jgi:hypothetical protein